MNNAEAQGAVVFWEAQGPEPPPGPGPLDNRSRSSCVCFNKSCKRSVGGVLGHTMPVVSESLSGSSSADVSRGQPAGRRILRQVPRKLT